MFGLHSFKLHRHLVDGTVKSVWLRQVFGEGKLIPGFYSYLHCVIHNIFITCKYIALLIFLLGIILGYHSELWVIAYDPREEPPDRQRPSGLGAGLPLQVPPADTRHSPKPQPRAKDSPRPTPRAKESPKPKPKPR